MGKDLKAEILAEIGCLDELIEKSTQIIEKTNVLLNQSHRLIREAKRHDFDRRCNHEPRHRALKSIGSTQRTV
jgi:hypothetical protein